MTANWPVETVAQFSLQDPTVCPSGFGLCDDDSALFLGTCKALGMATVLVVLLWLLPDVVMPRPADFLTHENDPVELERQTRRMGPGRLLKLLEKPVSERKKLTGSVLRGLSLVVEKSPDFAAQTAVPLLEILEQTTDERIRAALHDVLLRSCQNLGRSLACQEADDLGCGGELGNLPRRLLVLSERVSSPASSRNVALSALQSLPVVTWQQFAPRLSAIAQKETGSLRTTALAALSLLSERASRPELVDLLLKPDDVLSAAAAQELCWPLLLIPKKTPVAQTQLPAPVVARVRAIAQGTQPIAVRLQTVDCLRAFHTPQDKALLVQLAAHSKKR
jgi:hypothetical protein